MPVDLLTTNGKTDYTVTQSLERLAAAHNTLERRVLEIKPVSLQELKAEIRRLSSRVDVLMKQVNTLQNAP